MILPDLAQQGHALTDQRARWTTSGKRTPCPVCGRSTDDKCRRSAGLVDCWVGSTFSPPAHLQLGDTITISGESWALVSTTAGFGGNSFRFRPDHGRTARQRRPSARQRRLEAAAGSRAYIAAAAARGALHRTLAGLELQHLDLAQFAADLHNARVAVGLIDNALQKVLEARREGHPPPVPLHALTLWARIAGYQLADLERWSRWALGTPDPATAAGLESNTLKVLEVAA